MWGEGDYGASRSRWWFGGWRVGRARRAQHSRDHVSSGGVARGALNIRAIMRHPVVSRGALNLRLQAGTPSGVRGSGGSERGGEDAEVAAGGAFAAGDAEVDGAVEDAWFAVRGSDDHGGGAAAVEVDGVVGS